MEDLNTWILAGTGIAIWLTLIVYYFLLRATQKATQSQNLLTLINFLQSSELPEDRKILINNFKTLPDWTPVEKSSAENVCNAYDIAGILIKHKIVPVDIIGENWGASIEMCYEKAFPLIKEVREEQGIKRWKNFEWLAKIVMNYSHQNYVEIAKKKLNVTKGAESIKKSLSDHDLMYFFVSFVVMAIFLIMIIFRNEIVLIFPGIIAIYFTFYFGYSVFLEGFSKRLYNCKKIEDIESINDKNTLKCSIDIAKFNIQTLHSFLVMAIAVVTLIFTIYGLYTTLASQNVEAEKIKKIVFIDASIIAGMTASVIKINSVWYNKYQKLISIKLK